MTFDSNDQALLTISMKNAFQLGVYTRASRALMQCDEFSEFCEHVTHTLEEVGLSGCVKFIGGENQRRCAFGKGLGAQLLGSLRGLDRCSTKLCSGSSFFIFNSSYVLLIVDTEGIDAIELDLLADNLAIYMDTIQHWLEQQQRVCAERQKNTLERDKVIANLREFVACVTSLSGHLTAAQQAVNEDLLSQLISVFPVMGMEPDQEETILNIVNDARCKERALIEQQLRQNDNLGAVMNQAVAALLKQGAKTQKPATSSVASAGVILF